MRRLRTLAAFAVACASLSACDGLKEALTAHVDVVARAGSQELSVNRLGDLLGGSKLNIPVTRQNAQIITSLWVDYQLLAIAAANGDTTTDPKALENAAGGMIAGMKLRKYMDSVSKTIRVDSASEATYTAAAGGLLAARHILFATTPVMTPAQRDSVRKVAESIRAQVTDANFADMAKRYSAEPAAKESGGSLGVFPRGMMVKEFSEAVAALKPGEISGLVQTQFGFHIIQRLPYAAVSTQYAQAYGQSARQVAESTYLAGVEAKGNPQIREDAGKTLKEAAKNLMAHRKDETELAKYQGGELTVARAVQWINSVPQSDQLVAQMQQLPDTAVNGFVRAIVRNELLLREADKGKVGMTAEEQRTFQADFSRFVAQTQEQLGITPASLRDSAKTSAERQRLAAARADAYLERMVNGQAQPIRVPPVVEAVLMDKYEAKINDAGIERALERAQKVRQSSDSTRAAQQPRSQVPIPGMPGAGQQPPAGPPMPEGQPPAGHP
jgi:peptidyl-prolyl cis-trans isomerase D